MLHARDSAEGEDAIFPTISAGNGARIDQSIEMVDTKTRPFTIANLPPSNESAVPWSFRCFPILSLFALVMLTIAAVGSPYHWFFHQRNSASLAHPPHGRHTAQQIFAFYLLLMHLFGFMCAVRLCWATFAVTKAVSATRARCAALTRPKYDRSATVIHAIIVPSYKEDFDTLRSTLAVLASHAAAQHDYHVVVAGEERDEGAQHSAVQLEKAFRNSFLQLSFTTHPTNIPGEVAGKASNVNWAANEFMFRFAQTYSGRDVIFTVMDADTHLSADYFASVSYAHLDHTPAENATQIYCPPLVFDRNASKVPLLVRVADIVWSGAGLSGFHPQSTICIPTSVYSLPMTLARSLGGWDTGPDAIGEDMHMYLKSFFGTRGRVRVVPIYSPASSSNVTSTKVGMEGYLDGLHARWRQSLRHMWGSLDTGYTLRRAFQLLQDRNGSDLAPEQSKTGEGVQNGRAGYLTHILLYHRIFEAHCLPLHLTFIIIVLIAYSIVVPPKDTPPMLLSVFNAAGTMRFGSFLLMSLWMIFYNRYHALAVRLREAETRLSGLYDEEDFSHRDSWANMAELLVFPLAAVMFFAPGLVAQTCHLWTTRLEYKVSAKPMRRGLAVLGA